jgi:hypothetical protein
MTDKYVFNVETATRFTEAEFISRYFQSLYNPNEFTAFGTLKADPDDDEYIVSETMHYLQVHLCFKSGLTKMERPPNIPEKVKQLIDEAKLDFEFLVRTKVDGVNVIYTGLKPVLTRNIITIPRWKLELYEEEDE